MRAWLAAILFFVALIGLGFQVAESSSSAELERSLDRYLSLQYQAEFHVRAFERDLDRLLSEKKRFPEREINPLATASYRRLTELWPLVVLETHRLADVYEESAHSQRFHEWLKTKTEADLLQMVGLLIKLREIESASDRLPIWIERSNLEDLMRKHEAEIAAKAAIAARDAAVPSEPESDSLDQAKGQKVYPSPGAAGNFIGNQLDEGVFVLTFDDGPGPTSTTRLHKILTSHTDRVNKRGAPATFFVLIEKAYRSPEVLEATLKLGFRINNHSWTHPNFAKLGAEELRRQIVDSTHELQKFIGGTFRFFRCPYGACFAPKVPSARQLIADQNLIHSYWTIDSVDWKNIGRPERTASIVIKEMQVTKRGVILLHDIHESTVDATKLIIDWIKSRNSSGADLRLLDLEDAVDLVNRR